MHRLPSIGLVVVVVAALRADAPLPEGAVARLGRPQGKQRPEGASLSFSADAKQVTWVSTETKPDENTVTVHVWNVADGKEGCRCVFSADTATATTSVTFTPDGKSVLLGTYHEEGGPAKSTRFGESRIRVWDAGTGKERNRFAGKRGGDGSEFHTLAVAGDGKSVVASRDAAVHIYDAGGGRLVRQFTFSNEEEGGVLYEVLAPSGKLFASRLNANPVRLWDVATGKKLRELAGAGNPLAFSADGKVLVTGEDRVRLWSTATGKELSQVKGLARSAAVSADGKVFCWVSREGGINLGEVDTGKSLAAFRSEALAVTFSPDGKTLASLCPDGTVLLWKVQAR